MNTFKATEAGKYLSMTVEGRNISIHESKYLEEGETINRPRGAFVLLIVAAPEPEEEYR